MGFKSKRSKATDIPVKVRERVYDRDNGTCIFCGGQGFPSCHYIPRSAGGLGIEENVVCACMACHHMMDNSADRKLYQAKARTYLSSLYPDWDETKLIYDKWAALKGVS